MDKIKPALQWLFHNRFWVTCGLVSIISIATWYMAWTAIEKKRDDRARKLSQSKSSIENVLNSEVQTGVGEEAIRVHPNDSTSQGMQERIEEAANGALDGWTERYNTQKELLQYAGVLPKHIRDPLANHEPMEKPIEGGELLDEEQRDTFREEIPKHMPDLAKRINATWKFDAQGEEITEADIQSNRGKSKGGQSINRGPRLAVAKDLVIWDKTNQELWNSKITEFAGFNGNQDFDRNRPTSQQMLALSQDLWILRGIFDAIAVVNEGYTANDLAPIERLDHVLIGSDAINPNLGTLTPYSYVAPTVGSEGVQKSGGGLKSQRQKRRENLQLRQAKSKGKSATFVPDQSQSPFHGRYVDRDFAQLNEQEITNVITSEKLTDQSYLAVAKRVPVRIAVKMDERRVNDFLAAAANSPFAFEIRQVRINKHDPSEVVERKGEAGKSSANDKSSKLGLGGGTGGGGSMADGGSRGGGSGGDDGDTGPFRAEGRSNFKVKIEFIGIVKLYNPVNRSLFFPEEADQTASN